jgi:hypothetical protein
VLLSAQSLLVRLFHPLLHAGLSRRTNITRSPKQDEEGFMKCFSLLAAAIAAFSPAAVAQIGNASLAGTV